jgi:glycosyltransferase involved in cell wall biosynthesis
MRSTEHQQTKISAIVPINIERGLSPNFLKWFPKGLPSEFELIIILDTKSAKLYSQTKNSILEMNASKTKILHSTNSVPGLTRNLGLEIAEGEWITFWDDDDLPDLTGVAQLLDLASINSLDFALGNFDIELIDEPGRIISVPYSNNWEKDIAYFPGIWRFIFRKSSLLGLKFGGRNLGEDQEFLMDYEFFKKRGQRFEINTYTYFRGNSNQITGQTPNLMSLQSLAFATLERAPSRFREQVVISIFFWRQYLTLVKNCVKQKEFGTLIPPDHISRRYIISKSPALIMGFIEVLYRKLLEMYPKKV